jgi:quinol monooxygenase YgiN
VRVVVRVVILTTGLVVVVGRLAVVIQVVRVAIRPEARERWLDAVRVNAEQTRAEDGCEAYEVCEDVESPNTFVIVERWASLDAQFRHFRTPDFRRLMAGLGDLVAGPPEVSINEVSRTLTLDEALAAAGAR